MPPPSTPTIIGSTTVRANRAATAASTALPPASSISAPAAEASGWLATTIARDPVAGFFSQAKVAKRFTGARSFMPAGLCSSAIDPSRGSSSQAAGKGAGHRRAAMTVISTRVPGARAACTQARWGQCSGPPIHSHHSASISALCAMSAR